MLPTFFCRLLPAGYLKCTHMRAHTKSLPSGQAIFKKMYTFAGIFFRWFYVYTCILFFFSSPNFAGILPQQAYPQKCPSPTFTVFSHIFFAPLFLHKPKRQTKVTVKKNTSQDETGRKIVQKKKGISIHFNFIRIKSKEATAEQKKTEKIQK